MKSLIQFLMRFLSDKKVIEVVFDFLEYLASKTSNTIDNKGIEISKYVLTNPDAHKVIDKILCIIRESEK